MSAWYSRAWLAVTSPVLRLVGVRDNPSGVVLGADYAAFMAAMSIYDQRKAARATAMFPWLAASLPRKAGDLAGLPWAIMRGGYGTRGKPMVGHPMMAILERPNSYEAGSLFWRQIYAELWKTGEAYGIKVRDSRNRWTGIIWCPSARMDPIVGPAGYPVGYLNRQTRMEYPAQDVIHWRLPGSSDGPDHVIGTGVVEPLSQTLETEYALKARLSQASRQGRPSAVATPGDDLGTLGKEQVDAVRDSLKAAFSQASGGVAVIGRKLQIDPLDWSPVDLDAGEQLDRARTEQLAVAGVPPVRVGLETANFATAEMQELVYWGDELKSDSTLIDDVLTLHGRLEFGEPDLYVYRDFTHVPVLQKLRDQAIDRASKHIANGIDVAEAYRAEGLDDVKAIVQPAPVVAPPAEAAPARGANVLPLRQAPSAGWWEDDAVSRRLSPIVVARGDSASTWRRWLARVHTPAEIRLTREVSAVLRAQAAACAEEAAKLKPSRDYIGDLIDAMMPASMDAERWAGVRLALRAAIEAGVYEGVAQVGADTAWDAARIDVLTNQQLAQMVTYTSQATRDDIRGIMTTLLADGATSAEMQTAIMQSTAFSPMRALRIARTETTRGLGSGTQYGYQVSIDAGARIRQKWLTAGFEVREAHQTLEGQTVDVGAPFVIPSGIYKGETARFPGDFSKAALTVNCRCTTVAIDISESE